MSALTCLLLVFSDLVLSYKLIKHSYLYQDLMELFCDVLNLCLWNSPKLHL